MRRTILFGLLFTAAGVAAWGAKIAAGQVAGAAPSADAAPVSGVLVEEGAPGGAGVVTRFLAAPVPERRAAYAARGNGFVPIQIGQPEHDEEMQQLRRQEAELAHKSQSLVRKLADADDTTDRTPIVNELEDTIGKQFDVQQQVRELEVSRIEAKVKKLRETITKRAGARAAIVRNRREQLLQEAEGLGWNSPEGGHAGGWGNFGDDLYRPARDVHRLPAIRVERTPDARQ